MSIGTASITATATTDKYLAVSGRAWFRNAVTFTISGVTTDPSHLILLAYRGPNLVALCQTFITSGSSVAGVMDTNNAEMQAAFQETSPDGSLRYILQGAIKEVDLFLYDFSVPILLAMGSIEILASRDYSGASPVPPIFDGPYFAGAFAFYNNGSGMKAYIRNYMTGKYRLFLGMSGDGTMDTITDEITIPVAP